MIVKTEFHILRKGEPVQDGCIPQANEPDVGKDLPFPQEPAHNSTEDFDANLKISIGVDQRDLFMLIMADQLRQCAPINAPERRKSRQRRRRRALQTTGAGYSNTRLRISPETVRGLSSHCTTRLTHRRCVTNLSSRVVHGRRRDTICLRP